jgi:hypothetical protein
MQHWVKDMKYSTRVKDEEGYPAMALVNKATGDALKHSIGQSHPVRISSFPLPLLQSFANQHQLQFATSRDVRVTPSVQVQISLPTLNQFGIELLI